MKKNLFAIITIILLTVFISCDGTVDDSVINNEIVITYIAGSGTGTPISSATEDGYHDILPNSPLEKPEPQLLATNKGFDDGYAGFYKKGFSFYGWKDQDGKYYVYNQDENRNKIKFTKNMTLEALWRNDLTGEIMTGQQADEYIRINGYTGSKSEILIIPRVFTNWDDYDEPKEVFVTTIGKKAVSNENLKTVVLPDTVTEIKENAFSNCTNLEKVVIKRSEPPTINDNAFPGSVTEILVPKNSVTAYQDAFTSLADIIKEDTDDIVLSDKDTKYTVTFVCENGSSVPSQTVTNGGYVTKPDDLEKENHVFLGWYKDAGCAQENKWNFEKDKVTDNITLYAKLVEPQWFNSGCARIIAADVSSVKFVLAKDAPSTYKASWPCPYDVNAYLVKEGPKSAPVYSLFYVLKDGSETIEMDDDNKIFFGSVILTEEEYMPLYCALFIELVNKADLGKTFSSYQEYMEDEEFYDENEEIICELDEKAWKEIERSTTFFTDTESIEGLDLIDVSNMTDLSCMFYGCKNVESLDIGEWDISQVTNLDGMFCYCEKVEELEVGNWITSSVTNMEGLFCGCKSLTELDVADWNTSSVTNMMSLFSGCAKLETIDVSKWDTSSVTSMRFLFSDCEKLESVDVSGWKTSNVRSMEEMFSKCSSLETLNVTDWNVSKVKDMEFMFGKCTKLTATETSLNFSKWSINSNNRISMMFSECANIEHLDLSSFDVSEITSLYYIFNGCTKLKSVNIKDWDLSKVTNWQNTFAGCSSLEQVYIENENTKLSENLPDSTSWSYYSDTSPHYYKRNLQNSLH